MRNLIKPLGFVFLLFYVLIADAQTNPDVRLLIDKSGSMVINDPEKLRISGVQLLANMLPSDTKAGIWTFGTGVENLAPFAKATGAWKKPAIANSARKIEAFDQFTDIEAALKTASFDINRVSKSADKNIILLSDGMVDISKSKDQATKNRENQAAKDRLLRTTLPKLVNAGYKIHTIALSNSADKDLLNTLSQRSGGLFGVAKNADELLELFVKALQRSITQEEVPIKKDSTFLIDNSIIEFTVLAFHGKKSSPVALESPDNKVYKSGEEPSNINWYSTKKYDLITVKKPIAGDWKLLSKKDSANRVTVVSNLKMRSSDIPANIQRGKGLDLRVWFEQEGKVLKRQEFLNILTVTTELQDAEGGILQTRNLKKTQKAVDFTGSFANLNRPGDFTLALHANGKTFSRTLRKPLRVQDLMTAHLQQGDGYATLILRSEFKNIEPEKLQISANVGTKKFTPEYRGSGEWLADLSDAISATKQTVRVTVAGELVGKNLDLVLGNMTLEAKQQPEPTQAPVELEPQMPDAGQEPEPEEQKPTDASAVKEDILPNLELSAQVSEPAQAPDVIEGEDSPTQVEKPVEQEAQVADQKDKLQLDLNSSVEYETQQETSEDVPQQEEMQTQAPEPEPEPVADTQEEEPQAKQQELSQVEKDRLLWIYILVALGNIFLFLIAYFVYRKMIRGKREEILNN